MLSFDCWTSLHLSGVGVRFWPISSETLTPKRFPDTGYKVLCVTTQLPVGDARKCTWKFAPGVTTAGRFGELHPAPHHKIVTAGNG